MHAAVRHGTPSLTSLPEDVKVSCEVRPTRSPFQSFTSLDQAYIQSPDEKDCTSCFAIHSAFEVAWQGVYMGIRVPYFSQADVYFPLTFEFYFRNIEFIPRW